MCCTFSGDLRWAPFWSISAQKVYVEGEQLLGGLLRCARNLERSIAALIAAHVRKLLNVSFYAFCWMRALCPSGRVSSAGNPVNICSASFPILSHAEIVGCALWLIDSDNLR